MSSLINCHKISKTFSDKCLFNELTLAIEKKTKLGVLGPNGAGKSTLIKILSKKETTDEGTVSYAKGVKIHVVEQKSEFKSEQSISNTIKQNLENHIDALGIDISIKKLSTQLKIDDLSKNISSLSGGQKKKLAILLELEKSPDVVIFDEPTNHLDLSSVLWLEKILSKANYPWICISHDRFFLQQVAKSILEINPIFNNSHLLLSGSYDHFIKEKKVYLQDQENRFETIKNKLRKEDAWLKTSPKARTTKSKHRIEKAYDLKYQYKEIQEKRQNNTADITFSSTQTKAKKLLELKNISLTIGEKVICHKFSYTFTSGQKIGLLGLNGSGKTTFFKLLTQDNKNYTGSLTPYHNLKWVYFDQIKKDLDSDETLKTFLAPHGDSVVFQGRSIHIASWIERLGFSYNKLQTQIKKLSGGEKARALIAKLMLEEADLLLLDEPTNDLDIPTLEILEESLQSFTGSIILVSHDRYLLQKICNTYLGFNKEGLLTTFNDPSIWQENVFNQSKETKSIKREKLSTSNTRIKTQKKLSYLEDRELKQIDEKVQKLEIELEQLKQELQDDKNQQDYKRMTELSQSYENKQKICDQLYERWQELEDKKS